MFIVSCQLMRTCVSGRPDADPGTGSGVDLAVFCLWGLGLSNGQLSQGWFLVKPAWVLKALSTPVVQVCVDY